MGPVKAFFFKQKHKHCFKQNTVVNNNNNNTWNKLRQQAFSLSNNCKCREMNSADTVEYTANVGDNCLYTHNNYHTLNTH